jgi:hypothetical protein
MIPFGIREWHFAGAREIDLEFEVYFLQLFDQLTFRFLGAWHI